MELWTIIAYGSTRTVVLLFTFSISMDDMFHLVNICCRFHLAVGSKVAPGNQMHV